MSTETMCYVGIKQPCGCLVAAAVDKPEYANGLGPVLAGWIRDGYTIERATVDEVRARLTSCSHDMRAQDDTMDLFE